MSTPSGRPRGFGYDLLGRPTQIGTPDGHIEIVYDDRGNQVQFLGPDTVSFEGVAPGTTISYDAAGRADTRLDVVTGTTTFGYDAAGRVIEQHDPVTGTDLSVDYDQTGQVASVTTDDEAVLSFSYDPLSQLVEDTLVSAAGETTVSTTYAYDTAGNITERSTQGTMPAGRHQYAYDQASRLISWTSPDEQETEYSWDASGNRVQAGAETFEFDERNQLLSSSGGDTWSYNPDGTLKSQFVDGELRMDLTALVRQIDADSAAGDVPLMVVGTASQRSLRQCAVVTLDRPETDRDEDEMDDHEHRRGELIESLGRLCGERGEARSKQEGLAIPPDRPTARDATNGGKPPADPRSSTCVATSSSWRAPHRRAGSRERPGLSGYGERLRLAASAGPHARSGLRLPLRHRRAEVFRLTADRRPGQLSTCQRAAT